MSGANHSLLLAALQQLQLALQNKQYDRVISEATKLSRQYPKQSDLYHLAALAYKQKGIFNQAKSMFEQCLAINNKQPQVLNNLGNLLLDNKKEYDAELYYEKALKIDGSFADAWKNLALVCLAQRKLDKAMAAINKAESLQPKNVSILTIKADIYRAYEDFASAIKYYQSALQLNPSHVNALHNLGLTYKLSEQHEHAFACFQKARELAPSISQIDYNLANTLFEQGRYEQAEQFYWSALNKKPDDIDVHQTLNEFYWQRDQKDKFGHSFNLAIKHMPNNTDIYHAYAESMFDAKQYQKAEQLINQALALQPNARLLHTLGKIKGFAQENIEATKLFEQAIAQDFYMDLALDLINVAILSGDYEKALHYIAQAELREPNHQLLIAYKSTCWRLTNDERHDWLINYDKFVKPYELAVPNGYQTLSAFMEELEVVLLSMHQLNNEPLKQTLRNGTQTPGRLLHKKHPVISLLKQGLSDIVATYITSLPDDANHPLLSRKSTQFTFAGSWSVKLKPNGFHVNHVHPAGWLSSAFYVSVPDLTGEEQQPNAGAIKFGETSMNLGEREQIAKIIQPSVGTLALFPSYAWHGTIPFAGSDDKFRLTSPFDIVPL